MQPNSRVVVVVAFALTAGCAKPVAPVLGGSGAVPLSAASGARGALGSAASRPFDIRLRITGSIVTLDRAFQPRVDRNEAFYVVPPATGETRLDTVPAYGVLRQIQWRAAAVARASVTTDPDAPVALDAPSPTPGAEAREPARVFAPGTHEIMLEAPAHAGGDTVTVRFFAGFAPGTWWAGPDPDRWPRSSDGDGRAVEVTDWGHFTTVPAWPPDGRPYFGPDSFRYIPSQRRPVRGDFERRTFYEIHGDRIYARSEGDTIHADGWVVLCNGGYDKDTPYLPRVDATDPALPPGFAGSPELYPVLVSQGLAGSPAGFRFQVSVKLANGSIVRLPQSGFYPIFDPTSVFRLPQLAGYWRSVLPGKAYVVARSEDSDGLRDAPIADPVGLADRVDAGGGTPADRLERRKILMFYVAPAARPGLARGAMPGGPVMGGAGTRH